MKEKIRFICLQAYPVFDGSDTSVFGGAETRAVTFARGCVAANFSVSFVVDSPSKFKTRMIDDIEIINIRSFMKRVRASFYARAGKLDRFPWLKVKKFHPLLLFQLPIIAAAFFLKKKLPLYRDRRMAGLDVDAYLTFGVSNESARCIYNAKADGKKSLLFLMSNAELDVRFSQKSTYITPYGQQGAICHYAITKADAVVCQTEEQTDSLKTIFHRDALLIKNPIDLDAWQRKTKHASPSLPKIDFKEFVLWVGRADRFHKRPLLAVELARMCPKFNFVLILNPRDPTVEAEVAAGIGSNVQIIPSVIHADIPQLFQRMQLFLSTGSKEYEGFPNVFLQAAASRRPIVSLEAGADFILKSKSGYCANGDISQLKALTSDLLSKPGLREQMGNNGFDYVTRHHSLSTQTSILQQEIRRLIQK